MTSSARAARLHQPTRHHHSGRTMLCYSVAVILTQACKGEDRKDGGGCIRRV